jgi:hypothetical protein
MTAVVTSDDRDDPIRLAVERAGDAQHAGGVAAGRVGAQRCEALDEASLRSLPSRKSPP